MEDKPDLNLLYKRLCDSMKAENDSETLRISQQILQAAPPDTEIQLTSAIAMLRLGKYTEGVQLLQKISLNDPLLGYSLCYGLYKQGDYKKCLEQLKNTGGGISMGLQLIEAQIYYKQEKYEDASRIYQTLLEKTPANDENFEDFLVNMLSSCCNCPSLQEKALKIAEGFLSKKKEAPTREILFNLGLIQASLGDYNTCLRHLKSFQDLVEEDSDQTGSNDLLLAHLESDYIEGQLYQWTPETIDHKIEYYSQWEAKQGLEQHLKVVLGNNLAVLRSHAAHFHYQETLKALDQVINAKWAGKGIEIVLKLNKVLLSLAKNRLVEAQKLLVELENSYNREELRKNQRYIACKFYLLFKGRNFKGIEQLFNDFSSGNSSFKPVCLLIKAEISRLLHKSQETLAVLSDLLKVRPDFMKNEAFVVVLLSLVTQQTKENTAVSAQILETLSKNTSNSEILGLMGEVYEKNEDFNSAARIYETLLEKEASQSLVYKLLRCYSSFDSAKAEKLMERVQTPVDLIQDEKEIRKLLEKDAGFMSKVGGTVGKAPGSPRSPKTEEGVKKSIKKKKKKIRFPKNFDPSKPGPLPDAERWLPLYMRSKFKGKKGKKGIRGAQGEVTGKETVSNYKGTAASTANQEVVSSKKANKSKKKRK